MVLLQLLVHKLKQNLTADIPVVTLVLELGVRPSVTFGTTTTKLKSTNTVPFSVDGKQSLMPPILHQMLHKSIMPSLPSTQQ
jgi:hypothetical protein